MKRLLSVWLLSMASMLVWGQVPSNYYDKANGKKKTDLKSALRSIISKAKVLDYGSGAGKTWTGFYTTDRYNGNQVRDRYSNRSFYFSSSASAEAASAVSGMNIEHSFPKSWWGGSENQAYKDLYNLMPSESSINSSKSNYAMGVVTTAKTDNGCTKVGQGKAGESNATLWEPADKWKGDFARNYFYMVTAYSNLSWTGEGLKMLENNEWPTLQKWAYELLLKWSREDPVDEIETTRNEAVYGIQGNRNPFIDFPNLAEYIWGDSVDYAFSVDGSIIDIPVDTLDVDALLAADFTVSSEGWTVSDVDVPTGLESVWSRSTSYGMKASAYYNKTANKAESWLVSPEIDLSAMQSASLCFDHAGKYFGDMKQEATLWASTDGGETWSQLPIQTYMTGNDWNFVTNVTDLTALCGGKVKVAFKYVSSAEAAGQWEIRSAKVTGVKKAASEVDRFMAFDANEIVSSLYSTRFDANWAKYADGVTYTLDVYTKDAAGGRSSFEGFPVTTTENTYRVKGIRPSTTYYYQVVVYDEKGGVKAISNEVQVDFPAVDAIFEVTPNLLVFSSLPHVPSAVSEVKVSMKATLENKVTIEVEEPFEISLTNDDATDWAQSLVVEDASFSFFVRMSAQGEGEYKGRLTLTTAGLEARHVALTGKVDATLAFLENFEKGSKGSYAEKEVTCSAATWNMVNAVMAKDANSNDAYAVRIKGGGYVEMVTDKENGCDNLWFYAGLYNKDTDMKLSVQYSLDAGTTWVPAAEDIAMDVWQLYEIPIKKTGNIRLRFTAIGQEAKRVNVDDIQMSDYIVEYDPDDVDAVQEALVPTAVWYNLAGCRVESPLRHGFYLMNGKKYVR